MCKLQILQNLYLYTTAVRFLGDERERGLQPDMGGAHTDDTAMDKQDAERDKHECISVVNNDEGGAVDQKLIDRFVYKHRAANAC